MKDKEQIKELITKEWTSYENETLNEVLSRVGYIDSDNRDGMHYLPLYLSAYDMSVCISDCIEGDDDAGQRYRDIRFVDGKLPRCYSILVDSFNICKKVFFYEIKDETIRIGERTDAIKIKDDIYFYQDIREYEKVIEINLRTRQVFVNKKDINFDMYKLIAKNGISISLSIAYLSETLASEILSLLLQEDNRTSLDLIKEMGVWDPEDARETIHKIVDVCFISTHIPIFYNYAMNNFIKKVLVEIPVRKKEQNLTSIITNLIGEINKDGASFGDIIGIHQDFLGGISPQEVLAYKKIKKRANCNEGLFDKIFNLTAKGKQRLIKTASIITLLVNVGYDAEALYYYIEKKADSIFVEPEEVLYALYYSYTFSVSLGQVANLYPDDPLLEMRRSYFYFNKADGYVSAHKNLNKEYDTVLIEHERYNPPKTMTLNSPHCFTGTVKFSVTDKKTGIKNDLHVLGVVALFSNYTRLNKEMTKMIKKWIAENNFVEVDWAYMS